jgi:hypothetical protein
MGMVSLARGRDQDVLTRQSTDNVSKSNVSLRSYLQKGLSKLQRIAWPLFMRRKIHFRFSKVREKTSNLRLCRQSTKLTDRKTATQKATLNQKGTISTVGEENGSKLNNFNLLQVTSNWHVLTNLISFFFLRVCP